MRNTVTLIALLLTCSFSSNAQLQPSFNRGYFDPAGKASLDNDYDLVEAGNGDFLYPFNAGGIMRTSPTGSPLWAARFTTPSGSGLQRAIFNQVINISGGDQILIGSLTDTAARYIRTWDTPLICRVDAAGNLLWSKILPSSPALTYTHAKSIRAANGDIVTCIEQGSAGSTCLLITRMTEHGGIIWQKMLFNDTNVVAARLLSVWDISECVNGDFLFIGPATHQYYNVMGRMRGNGALLWAVRLDNRLGAASRVLWKVRELPLGNIRMVVADPYQHIAFGGTSKFGMGYYTLDPFGNLAVPGKAFEMAPYSPCQIRDDGSMLFGGYSQLLISDSGAVKFSRRHNSAVSPVFRTVQATGDGGFAFGGAYQSGIPGVMNGYLLKTDSLGDAPPLSVPQAVTDTFFSNTTGFMINLKDSAVSIPLQKSAAITLTRIPFSLRDTSFTETLTVPFVGAGEDLRIYPNPASAQLYFNSLQPLELEIYDATGRFVRAEKASRSIDVSSLPSGTYLLRFRDNEGKELGIRRFQKL